MMKAVEEDSGGGLRIELGREVVAAELDRLRDVLSLVEGRPMRPPGAS